jgi:hypothetical protein
MGRCILPSIALSLAVVTRVATTWYVKHRQEQAAIA